MEVARFSLQSSRTGVPGPAGVSSASNESVQVHSSLRGALQEDSSGVGDGIYGYRWSCKPKCTANAKSHASEALQFALMLTPIARAGQS